MSDERVIAMSDERVTCPCGRRLRIKPEYRGKCTRCGRAFVVPAEGAMPRMAASGPPRAEGEAPASFFL